MPITNVTQSSKYTLADLVLWPTLRRTRQHYIVTFLVRLFHFAYVFPQQLTNIIQIFARHHTSVRSAYLITRSAEVGKKEKKRERTQRFVQQKPKQSKENHLLVAPRQLALTPVVEGRAYRIEGSAGATADYFIFIVCVWLSSTATVVCLKADDSRRKPAS